MPTRPRVEAGVATGVVFSPATEEALGEAIRRTIALCRAAEGVAQDAAPGDEVGCLLGTQRRKIRRPLRVYSWGIHSMTTLTIETTPFAGPETRHFRAPQARDQASRQPNYVENFVQSIFDSPRRDQGQDAGDRRRRPLLQRRRHPEDHPDRLGATGSATVLVGQDGLLSTPASEPRHPSPQGVRWADPVGQPQSGRTGRRFSASSTTCGMVGRRPKRSPRRCSLRSRTSTAT